MMIRFSIYYFLLNIIWSLPVYCQQEKIIEVDLAMEVCKRSDIYHDAATLASGGPGATFRLIPYLLKLNTENVFLSYTDTMYTLDSLGIRLIDRRTFGKYEEMEDNISRYDMVRFKSRKFKRGINKTGRYLNKTGRIEGWRKKQFDGYLYLALYRMKIRVRDTSRVKKIFIINLFKNRKLKGGYVEVDVRVVDILEIIDVKSISAREYLDKHSKGNRVEKFIKRTLGVGQVPE